MSAETGGETRPCPVCGQPLRDLACCAAHFAEWGVKLAAHLSTRTGVPTACYHGGMTRTARDAVIEEFQTREGPGALVLSLKAGGTGLNLTAASHVVLYDRWWNPAVEDQARDRAWRIGQTRTVISHRLVCPGTVDTPMFRASMKPEIIDYLSKL